MMKSQSVAISLAVLVATVPALFAQSKPKHFTIAPDQIKWTAPPEGMIRGTPSVDGGSPLRYALIEGDPMKPGAAFTIVLGCSDGFKAAPHWHPTDENLVVLEGTFALGAGDKFDPAGLQDMPSGGYGFMPRRMHHFGMCKGETEVLIYGTGPFQSNFVSAAKANPDKK